jgi:hypothetical protein
MSVTWTRRALQSARALRIGHRFKVKAFSSIWNALAQTRAPTALRPRVVARCTSVGLLALLLL